jgi:DNA-binding PadR family transcriptional regulator
MAGPQLTSFEHILLGMICGAPSSGYDLKRIFSTTPMGLYQPSSGTLYPALRRLEQKGLIRATRVHPAGAEARRRRAYEPTEAGRAAHVTWLREPVDPATASRDLGLHLMRFVMMEHTFTQEEVLAFLHSLRQALATLTEQLAQYLTAAAKGLPGRHPALALDHGLAVHQASLHWTERAIATLASQENRASQDSPPSPVSRTRGR